MKISATLVQDRDETWFKGQKDEREVRVFTMLDTDPTEPMPNTFDYRPSKEETDSISKGALIGRVLEIAVRKIEPAKGGRLVFSGKLVGGLNGSAPGKTEKK